MIDAIYTLSVLFFVIAGVFAIGAIVSNWLDRFCYPSRRMATRIRAGRHYQGK